MENKQHKDKASSPIEKISEGSTDHPVAFISYSWSSPQHKERVRQFADRLIANGVQVVIDTYDSQPGQDLNAFMEQSVTRKDITHVLVFADKIYAEKADQRSGGVGTETQLLSQEVYERVEQTKVVPLIFECDEEAQPYLPTYMKSRFHINFTNPERFDESFDQLLRHFFKTPKHSKPPLGQRPDFETAPAASEQILEVVASTSVSTRRESYGVVLKSLESFRELEPKEHLDEKVMGALTESKHIRDALVALLSKDIAEAQTEEQVKKLLKNIDLVLTTLASYTYPPPGINQWRDSDYDHFGFMLNEMIMYLVALVIKHEQFRILPKLLNRTYFFRTNTGEQKYGSLAGLRTYQHSLDSHRNSRLKLNRVSITADLLKERADNNTISFDELNSADSILYLVTKFMMPDDRHQWWFPRLSVYRRDTGDLPPLSEMVSKARAAEVIQLFGFSDLDKFKAALQASIGKSKQQQPIVDTFHYNPPSLERNIPLEIGIVP
jgi:hypothetical protein